MKKTALQNYLNQDVKKYLSKISFFKALLQANKDQHDLLVSVTDVIVLEPGEVIINKGSVDRMFYSVVQGKLDVFADDIDGQASIGHVSAGQVVGGLSLISQKPRTATLAASRLNGAVLLATDFKLFGHVDDFSHVDLETKLCLFRNVVNFTTWKLDEYRHHSKDEKLAAELGKILDFSGIKDSLDELIYLEKQSLMLGRLLGQWNEAV
ncbi:MAG: cyclic nucleotide-binding domain-containing protein [Pseudomonadales bacterium]|nr:cyclic nucleotide-binding domain-containing protein [Pseudomonadales bacterium]